MALTDKLTAIGDSIRGVMGGEETYTLDEMAEAVALMSAPYSWETPDGWPGDDEMTAFADGDADVIALLVSGGRTSLDVTVSTGGGGGVKATVHAYDADSGAMAIADSALESGTRTVVGWETQGSGFYIVTLSTVDTIASLSFGDALSSQTAVIANGVLEACFMLREAACPDLPWHFRSSTVRRLFAADGSLAYAPSTLAYAFRYCYALEALDTSGWDLSNVTTLANAFHGCPALEALDTSGWDLSGVTTLANAFYDCHALEALDTSGWDLSNVTTLAYAFYGCHVLEALDTSGWDLSNVTTLEGAFYGCHALEALDTSGWDLSNVTTLAYAFYCCYALEALDTSGWDLSNVTTLEGAFYCCYALEALDTSGWDLSGVTTLAYAFRNCYALEALDTSGWDLSNVTTLEYAFRCCYALETLDFGTYVPVSSNAFYDCYSLTSLVLRYTGGVCPMAATNALSGSAIASGEGYVYVPDDLVEEYQSATNWATYADQIKALSELEG